MIRIGCHLSSSRGYEAMGREALSLGGNTFQFFTRNPRGGSVRARNLQDEEAWRRLAEAEGLGPVVAHAPYTLNPCSADARVRDFALEVLRDDLTRLEAIPGALYNLHPGCHVGQGTEKGVELIAGALNAALEASQRTVVLLETMAGKGSEVGSRFEELRAIIDRVEHRERLGVCLDTCHVHDAGYDLARDPDGVLTEFDRVIGLERLRAVHLNDSCNPLGARKDRHARLGEGCMGLEALLRLSCHAALAGLPMVLETPNDLPGYAREMALVKAWGDKKENK